MTDEGDDDLCLVFDEIWKRNESTDKLILPILQTDNKEMISEIIPGLKRARSEANESYILKLGTDCVLENMHTII